jgi:hypothetical protein
MATLLARLRPDIVLHGMRSSLRDWAGELAHSVGSKVERSYARSDLFERRRALMDAWSQYATGMPSAALLACHNL